MKSFAKILVCLLATTQMSFGQNVQSRLEKAYQAFKADEQTRYASTSLCVLDATTGKVIFAANENVGLSTASTLKNITAATSFYILGKDFKYETKLSHTGSINQQGTLNGDLIIGGSGDPTLGSWRYENTKENYVLNQWVAAIKAAGIQKIEGRIIGDDSAFGTETVPQGWVWQDLGNYYGAGGSALNWRENQFDVKLKAGRAIGDSVNMLRTVPETPYIKLSNELKTGSAGSGDRAYAFLPPYSSHGYLRGTWGLDIKKTGISLSLPDGAFDLAYRLKDTLARLGISSKAPTTARQMFLNKENISSPKTKLISTYSPSLSQIIYWFQKKSVNLYGEQLLKTIAHQQGKEGNTKNGTRAVIDFWAGKGIDKDALNMIDGSGLSPGNRVTTLAMASILFQVQKEEWFSDYLNSFPENNGMRIKSGNINDVTAYAGYYTDNQGNKYIAVINANNYSGSGISKKLFRVLDALK
jgi:D-alanyl-D-alanine carboxypeptidase/D-alanyl-D-alanine-endopeptidase (penicillin-binding protein 4)